MNYNFDEYIERKGTNCVKWDDYEVKFEGLAVKNLLPMWIADMDFKAPEPVINALVNKARHGVLGYTMKPNSFYDAIINWSKKRFDWEVKKESIIFTPGVIPGFTIAIQILTNPGDGVIIQMPVYYPFMDAINNNDRIIKNNQLINKEGFYEIDFEDFERKAKDPKTKLFILSNPHNPVGRVFTKYELKKLADICLKHDVKIVSDEIHGDIIFPGHEHIPLSSLSEEISNITISTHSPSKTFNLAGLQTAYMIIPSDEIRTAFNKQLTATRIYNLSAFGQVGLESAYNESEEYLVQLLYYLEDNIKYVDDFIKENLSFLKMYKPEGTYLLWIDFSKTGMTNEEINCFIIEEAKIAVDLGEWFGEGGNYFARFNIACPRSILEKAMMQLKSAFDKKQIIIK